jgi:hypothetical protein
MHPVRSFACSICGEEKLDQPGWFLLMEDPWLDSLQVLHWEEQLATRQGTHSLCNPIHVQELVAHWMVTGSLSYPFASATGVGWIEREIPASMSARNAESIPGSLIGQLAVHRESLKRILDENPHALSPILAALLEAMQTKTVPVETRASREEDEFATV